MRFVLTADKEFYDELVKIRKAHAENGSHISLKEVVEEAVFFLHQLNALMANGYKVAIIDPQGRKHFISKRQKGKSDDSGTDERGDSKGPQG